MLNVGPSISMDSTLGKIVSFGNDAIQKKNSKQIILQLHTTILYDLIPWKNNPSYRLTYLVKVNFNYFHA